MDMDVHVTIPCDMAKAQKPLIAALRKVEDAGAIHSLYVPLRYVGPGIIIDPEAVGLIGWPRGFGATVDRN
jgi:hypothetical protein